VAHFYGIMKGARGETTRCGTRPSGITATVKSWGSSLQVTLSDRDGVDQYAVQISPIYGKSQDTILLLINDEEFVYFKGKVYKERHEVLGEVL
jgi:hypothetical protein